VYAGRDGNVYRQQGGGWQKYENGSWGSVDTPQPRDRATSTSGAAATSRTTSSDTVNQLDRDRAARSEGTTRTRDYSSTTRSSGATSRSQGTYRPSGGMRGGGRRR
jgi:hypothetical protein